jgi:hypothetical protein
MQRDPFDPGNGRPPLGVILLWALAVIVLLAAVGILVKGEQVRSELDRPDQTEKAPTSDSDRF